MKANSIRKPKRKKLPKPFVFEHKGNWICQYFVFNEDGCLRPSRKYFANALKQQGIEPTPEAQLWWMP